MRDLSWQEPLFASIHRGQRNRLLAFGPGSISTGLVLARRFPDFTIIAAHPSRKAIEGARRNIANRDIPNLAAVEAPSHERLPFDASTFDVVILLLTLHDRSPEEKLFISKEMLCVLRRGGTLHVADYDSPTCPREGVILGMSRYISGESATNPHVDGSWTQCFRSAGFAGVRRIASHSISIGRISTLTARKR